MAETLRAFVAIELPPLAKEHLREILAHLRRAVPAGIRWGNPEGIHLTLKFLGNVEAQQVPALQHSLERAVRGQQHFTLHLQGLGAFPNLRAPRVLWVGLVGEVEALRRLHRRVDEELVALGFASEERKFAPHLTLGRVRERLSKWEAERLSASLESIAVDSGLEIAATGVSLMQSTLLPSGAVYGQIAEVAFPPGEDEEGTEG